MPAFDPEHLQRCLDEMKRRDVDVLILGRESNARYVCGATRLWLAGTRPFGPGCVVVRDRGTVHLLSTTDDLVPLAREQLFPMSWNPANIAAALAAIPGVAGARRVGVDGMTPLFAQLLPGVLPDATLTDGEELLASVRRVKSASDAAAIRAAIGVAEDALRVALRELRPGVRERDLAGAFVEATGGLGVTTPEFDAVFHVIAADDAPASFATGRAVEQGDMVVASVGVLANGWVGRLARTWPCGEPTKAQRAAIVEWRAGMNAAAAPVCPGTRVGDLRTQNTSVRGVGTGDELLDDDQRLQPGMVLAVRARHEGVEGEDTFLVTDRGATMLT
ncbi:MAG: M24 family metallopeptidase, partial [Actinobacteria bacterium]|nr:M24 family metallopeptidase [Actinomycetota bacterium]